MARLEDCLDRILLVGEDNPYGSPPEYDLYPRPEGCAGHRLRKMLGIEWDYTYLAIERVNLCRGKWSIRDARASAMRLLEGDRPYDVVVMLGAKVKSAFKDIWADELKGLDFFGSTRRTFLNSSKTFTLVSLPHPSGRNRIWNDPANAARVRPFLEEILS